MKQPSATLFTLLILLAMTAWGGSWTSAKLIANMAPPEVLVFWRFLFSFLAFVPVMFLFRKSFRLKGSSLFQVLLGSVFIVTYNKFFFTGLQNGLAGAGGVLVTTLNPILTFLFVILFFEREAAFKEIAGLILGFAGGAILLEVWSVSLNKLFASGNAFFIIASAAWASLTITSEKSRLNMSPIVFSFYVNGISAFLDFFLAVPYDLLGILNDGWLFWGNILYMSIMATVFATTIYFAASGRLGSQRASSFIFLVPTSAVLISWVILLETPKLSTIIGGVIAMSAVYLINVGRKSELSGSPNGELVKDADLVPSRPAASGLPLTRTGSPTQRP